MKKKCNAIIIFFVVSLFCLSCNNVQNKIEETTYHLHDSISSTEMSGIKEDNEEESLTRQLHELSNAQLTDQTLHSFNIISKKVDGENAEWFNEIFFRHFHDNPEKVLLWIYEHKKNESLFDRILEMQAINEDSVLNDATNDELGYYPSRKFVVNAIERIKNNDVKIYLLNRLKTYDE